MLISFVFNYTRQKCLLVLCLTIGDKMLVSFVFNSMIYKATLKIHLKKSLHCKYCSTSFVIKLNPVS